MDHEIDMLEDIVESARARTDPQGKAFLASNLGGLGNTYAKRRDAEKALKNLNESLEIYRSLDDNHGMAQACFSIASVYDLLLGDKLSAKLYLKLGFRFNQDKNYKLYADRLVRLEIEDGDMVATPNNIVNRYRELGFDGP
jgi:tetratricopeptide (TPR) repeat protein